MSEAFLRELRDAYAEHTERKQLQRFSAAQVIRLAHVLGYELQDNSRASVKPAQDHIAACQIAVEGKSRFNRPSLGANTVHGEAYQVMALCD